MVAYASTIISFIAFLYYSALLFIIWRQDIRSRVRLYFGLFLLSMMIWSFAAFMMFSGLDLMDALFWNRALVIGSTFMPISFFGFVSAFILKDRRIWLYLGFVLYVLIQITNVLGLLITKAEVVNGWLLNQYGPALALSGFSWMFFIVFSTFDLVVEYRKARDFQYRNRLRYLLLVGLVIFLGTLTNLHPVLMKFPSDVALNIVSAMLITFAILRHQLLDITVVVRRSLFYSILTALIGASYYLVILASIRLFPNLTSPGLFVLALVVAFITALAAQPLQERAQGLIDRLFFREKYDATLMLQRVSRTAASVLEVDKLAHMILAEVTNTLHMRRAVIFLKREETQQFLTVAAQGFESSLNLRLDGGHPIVQALEDMDRPLDRADLAVLPQLRGLWEKEREALELIGAELFIPLKVKGQLVGIFATGPKLSGEDYSPDDHLTLTTLANQTVVAFENARLYSAEQSRREELDALYRLNRQLVATDEVAVVLEATVRQAVESVHVTFARALVLKEDGSLVCQAAYPITELGKTLAVGRVEPDAAMPHYRKALANGAPLLLHATQPDLDDAAITAIFLEIAASVCLAPLTFGDRAIGILLLGERRSASREPFDADKMRLIAAIADQAASALQRSYLHEQMENNFVETVLALANAMDARDTYTGNHSQRLAILAEIVGRKLNFSEEEIQALHWAALLHDIGKIGVPDEILRKPGPLTSEEWTIMKRHPDIGARIVAPVKKLKDVAPIIRAHQERYDGTGYPDGLKGEEIPIAARLLAVVDAYGAMTDERVYRRSLSHEEAVRELLRNRGTQFDPLMVDVFLKVLEEEGLNADVLARMGTRPLQLPQSGLTHKKRQ
jgi:putative nucleotidyltransferase with HDIG domain